MIKSLLVILIINANAALHGHGDFDGVLHGGHTFCHQLRFSHQAGSKSAVLHPVGGAAHIQIYFAIAIVLTNHGRFGQHLGIAATKLKCHRLLKRIKPQQSVTVAMTNSLGRHHLGVKQGMPGEVTVEHPAVPIGSIHHGGHAKPVCGKL